MEFFWKHCKRKTIKNKEIVQLDHNYFELLEMSRRQEGMLNHMLDVMRGEPHVQMNNYLKQLQSTLNACEAARQAIDKKLIEME